MTTGGIAHVVGESASTDFPAENEFQSELHDPGAAFVSTDAAQSFSRTLIPGVSVHAMAVDPTNAQIAYAGTSNGVYATANGGTSWSRVDTGLTYTNVRALAVDPQNTCVLYGGVDTQNFVLNTNAVFIVSTNCGVTWGFLAGVQTGRTVWSVALANTTPTVVYIGESRNSALDVVTRITPPGTFEHSQPGSGNYRLATDPANPCTVYAGDFSGNVYRSTVCSGWNWTGVGATLDGGVLSLAVHPTGQPILAGTNTGKIYRKADAGSPWVAVAALDGLTWSLAFKPGDPTVAYATGGGTVYKSLDGGEFWNPASTPGPELSSLGTSPASPDALFTGSFSNQDGFYVRLSAAGAIYDASLLGGHGFDAPRGVAAGVGTAVVIAGYTYATDLPVTSGSPQGNRDGFLLTIDTSITPPVELVQNGDFASGTTGWLTFGTPDASYMESNVTNEVFQLRRVPQPAGQPVSQAVVFQNTGVALAAGTAMMATFDLGNTSSARKYMKVLLVGDAGFSDMAACTFWLEPNAPLRTYQMRASTTQAWTDAAVYFYASSPNTDGGYYQVDNVSFATTPGGSLTQTVCVDPLAPNAPGGAAGPNLVTNGTFGTGLPAPWTTFGTITLRSPIVGTVLEMIRPTNVNPPGVVLNATGQAMANDQILTATFQLGNSSGVRQRVLVIVHDLDFSDLVACNMWLTPGQGLTAYTMTLYASKAWTNATVAVYPRTVGNVPWVRLDNVTLTRTPATAIVGTTCVDGGPAPAAPAAVESSASSGGTVGLVAFGSSNLPATDPAGGTNGVGRRSAPAGGSAGATWEAVAVGTGPSVWDLEGPVDLTAATEARLTFASWLSTRGSTVAVEVSLDGGGTWVPVAEVAASETWAPIEVDLGAYVGQVLDVRFVFDAVAPADPADPDVWQVDDVQVLVSS